MTTKEQSRLLIVLSRKGKLEGDPGVKGVLQEAVKMALDLDFNEKPYYRSALWEATWKNHETIVKLLVEKGASVDFKDFQERTPLHEAAYYGHVNLVEFYIEKGAGINAVDKFGQTPLFRAVDGGRHDCVELLVKRKAETNLLDAMEVSPQHIAAFQGLPAMSEWLLYKGSWKNRFAIEGNPRDRQASKKATQPQDRGEGQPAENRPAEAGAGDQSEEKNKEGT